MREQAVGAVLDPPGSQCKIAAAIQEIERAITEQAVEPVCLVTGIEFTHRVRKLLIMLHGNPSKSMTVVCVCHEDLGSGYHGYA